MQHLSLLESQVVSGGTITWDDNTVSNYDLFVSGMSISAGAVTGTFVAIPAMIGIAAYNVAYYAVYKPIEAVAYYGVYTPYCYLTGQS